MKEKTFQMLSLILLFIVGLSAASQAVKKPLSNKDGAPAKKETSPDCETDNKFFQLSIEYYCGGNCSIEAYIIDPLGRKLGIDAISGAKFSEIPFGEYSGLAKVENLFKNADRELNVEWAVSGDYQIILANTNGRNDFYRMVVNGISIQGIGTGPNIVSKFLFHADSENMKYSFVAGGFYGGGQSPKDVNKFLTYANPSDSQTELPSGTTTFPLMIFYHKNIIPSTFKAVLNGADITSYFHPNPGNYETININLISGRNVLLLSIVGNLDKRVATDSDRLVFIVK